MSKYITKQRVKMIEFLSNHADEVLTVRQMADALASEDVSASAVYRNVSELEAENKLRRVAVTGSREIYYQYSDTDECRGCLHMSCKECGKTFHMQKAAANELVRSVENASDFEVDKTDTVLYGICSICKNKKNN